MADGPPIEVRGLFKRYGEIWVCCLYSIPGLAIAATVFLRRDVPES